MTSQGFSVDGRIVICGYQEDAIPSYVSCHDEVLIDDEQSIKTDAGWDAAPGALCGFLTGFILKDVNKLIKNCKRRKNVLINMVTLLLLNIKKEIL